jgi:hypothetical protein
MSISELSVSIRLPVSGEFAVRRKAHAPSGLARAGGHGAIRPVRGILVLATHLPVTLAELLRPGGVRAGETQSRSRRAGSLRSAAALPGPVRAPDRRLTTNSPPTGESDREQTVTRDCSWTIGRVRGVDQCIFRAGLSYGSCRR